MKTNSATLIFISDRHVGSTTGLMPLDGVILKDKNPLGPNPFQKEIAEFWNEFWKRRSTDPKPRIVFDLGDKVDGRHHDSTQIWGTIGDHINAVIEMDMKVRRGVQRMYSINGTPIHVGKEGDADDIIAHQVGYDQLYGRWSNYQVRPTVAGVRLDLAHQGPSVGKRAWNRENQLRLFTKSIMMTAIAKGEHPPQIVVRGHRHKKCGVLVEYEGFECYGFVLPGWQLKTEYASAIASEEWIADIGGLVVYVDNGKIIPKWDVLTIDEVPEVVL